MRTVLAAVSLAVVTAACASQRPPTTEAAPAPKSACSPGSAANEKTSLELIVLGSGGPRSFGRAASSYLIAVDGAPRILVDVGPGTFLRLGELDADLERLDTILLTHLHIDHSGDLAAFVKARDLTYNEPLRFRIFGPDAGSSAGSASAAFSAEYPSTKSFVDRLLGEHGAFAYLPAFRNKLALEVTDLPITREAPIREVLREGDLRVTSIAVDHDNVPAVAYRVEHRGHAIVVSGDLASKNDNLASLADRADVLVYDAAVVDPPGSPAKLYDLHTSPKRIGEVAAKAHVKSVLLGHVPPNVESAKADVLRSVHATFGGPADLASDCLRVRL